MKLARVYTLFAYYSSHWFEWNPYSTSYYLQTQESIRLCTKDNVALPYANGHEDSRARNWWCNDRESLNSLEITTICNFSSTLRSSIDSCRLPSKGIYIYNINRKLHIYIYKGIFIYAFALRKSKMTFYDEFALNNFSTLSGIESKIIDLS